MSIYDQKTVTGEVPEEPSGNLSIRPGSTLGEYKIISELGKGGMGTVYKAYQESLQRHVAIKVLETKFSCDTNFISRFKIEAISAAKLQHPNIIQIFGIGEENITHYFIMELVSGKTLKELVMQKKGSLIRSRRFFPVYDTLQIILQVAQGLQHAHEQGIIHRDIKPSNIIEDEKTNRMMIGDFGLAKPVVDANKKNRKIFEGTPFYMAPELFSDVHGTVQTDIYALGASFFELLTGRPPFLEKDFGKLTEKILHEEPPEIRSFNSKIPSEICCVVKKCLEKLPAKRYRTVHEFIKDIFLFLNEGRTLASESIGPLQSKKAASLKIQKPRTSTKLAIIIIGLFAISGTYLLTNTYLGKRMIRLKQNYCQQQLQISKNYLQLGRTDLAVPVLKKLCKDYPDTRFADQANQILENIPKTD